MDTSMYAWVGFIVFVLAMLALDLGGFNRRTHEVKIREALGWTAFWVSLAMIFCAGLYYFKGHEKALEFLAGYLIEESLSMDNLFVFLLIFRYFGIPAMYEHKLLFWGILGALVMRASYLLGRSPHQPLSLDSSTSSVPFSCTRCQDGLEKDKEIHPKEPLLILL
jgi:tellurite resistance protein TerC